MFDRIAWKICLLFAIAIAVGFGLTCYYYVWLSTWSKVAKVFAIIGFSILAIICVSLCGFITKDIYEIPVDTLDSFTIAVGIAGIILCGVVPGVLYMISCQLYGTPITPKNHNSGSYSPQAPAKRRAPDYDPDNDPAIIKVTKKPINIPKSKQTGKKKLVYKPKKD